jgi:type II secretory pathway pseudopilin PulG
MKPVNLLPESYRPRRPSGQAAGSSRIVIGLLAALLVMAVVYALSANQVNSRKSRISSAKSEVQRAQAQATSQSAFGTFHDMKQTRVTSVTALAGGRFDWERLMREVALVLPRGTWILDMTTSTGQAQSQASGGSTSSPPPSSSSSSSSSSAASASSGSASSTANPNAPATPTAHIIGCALHQNDVAVLLVRLRKLHRATDADLTESAKEDQQGSSATGEAAGSGGDTCGDRRFKFDVTVTFSPATVPSDLKGDGHVPVSLGGGS